MCRYKSFRHQSSANPKIIMSKRIIVKLFETKNRQIPESNKKKQYIKHRRTMIS